MELKEFKNLEPKGRQLVSVKRIARNPYWVGNPPIDFTDFEDRKFKGTPYARIYAIIPGWQDDKGVITSLRTGKIVPVRPIDKVVPEYVGDAFDYQDGSIQYTSGWQQDPSTGEWTYGPFFVIRTCRDEECVHHPAFGEDILSDPRARARLF